MLFRSDSARLSPSQVSLYVGGWLLLLCFTLGMIHAWDRLASASRYALPAAATVTVFLLGLHLWCRSSERVAYGYLVTATLAFPACIGLFLYETKLIHPAVPALDTKETELLGKLFANPLTNRELLLCAAGGLGLAILLRRLTRTGVFTPPAVLLALLGLGPLLGCLGGFWHTPDGWARLGLWYAAAGAAALWPALRRDHGENCRDEALSPATPHPHDAWSILLACTLMLPVGLALTAMNRPDLYFPWTGATVSTESRCAAFMVNGGLLWLLSWLYDRRPTPVRKRLAALLRWAIPAHLLWPLARLENAAATPAAWFRLAGLAAGAVGFCYGSILRQWRPFVVSGLAALAWAYARLFIRLAGPDGNAAALTNALWLSFLASLAVLFLAPRLPAGKR